MMKKTDRFTGPGTGCNEKCQWLGWPSLLKSGWGSSMNASMNVSIFIAWRARRCYEVRLGGGQSSLKINIKCKLSCSCSSLEVNIKRKPVCCL